MPTRAHCCYSYRPYVKWGADWETHHHAVNKFKKALKGEIVQKHAFLPAGGFKRYLTNDNKSVAFDVFAWITAPWLAARHITSPLIIPIPNSKCTVSDGASRTAAMAVRLATETNGDAVDVLRWLTAQPSSHLQGGSRDPKVLFPELVLIDDTIQKDRPTVLVDDVMTSGGHARAAVAVLRAAGFTGEIVTCCAVKTTHDNFNFDQTFAPVELDLEDYVPESQA